MIATMPRRPLGRLARKPHPGRASTHGVGRPQRRGTLAKFSLGTSLGPGPTRTELPDANACDPATGVVGCGSRSAPKCLLSNGRLPWGWRSSPGSSLCGEDSGRLESFGRQARPAA